MSNCWFGALLQPVTIDMGMRGKLNLDFIQLYNISH